MKKKMLQIDEQLVKDNLINLKQIVFEVTEQCNLNCKYCGLSEQLYDTYEERTNRNLSFEKAKLIIDYLLDLWKDNHVADTVSRFTVSFYGGEPLLNVPLIRKIIDYIEQAAIVGRQIRYSMTTNAMLLDKHIDFLAEKNVSLLVSLDGDEEAQSYRIDHSGNNSFHQIMHNVKLAQNKYPDYFNTSVNFISVLHNRNDVEPLLRFFNTYFDKTPMIVLLNSSGVSEHKKEEFRKMYQNMAQSLMKSPNCEAIETEHFLTMPKGYRLSKNLYSVSGNIFYNYNQLLLQKIADNELYTGTCTPFAKRLFVTVDGKILPCERIDHDFALGYVHDDFVELDYKHVAERHNYYTSKFENQCIACAVNKSCPRCVYQIDGIREQEAYCEGFCTKEAAEKEKQQIFSYLRQHPHYYERVLNEVSFNV